MTNDLVIELRKLHSEIIESDGHECEMMALVRRGADEIAQLRSKVDASYNRGFAEGSGNEGEYQREITQHKRNLAWQSKEIDAQVQKIQRLNRDLRNARESIGAMTQAIERMQGVIATREEALLALTRELPPLTAPEPSEQQATALDQAYYHGARGAQGIAHQSIVAMDDWIAKGCGNRVPPVKSSACAYIGAPQGEPKPCVLSAGHPPPHVHVEPSEHLSASEAASFDSTLGRSPRRIEPCPGFVTRDDGTKVYCGSGKGHRGACCCVEFRDAVKSSEILGAHRRCLICSKPRGEHDEKQLAECEAAL